MSRRPRRAGSYRGAITWIAENDDNEWLSEDGEDLNPSVAASLVADVLGRGVGQVAADLRRALRPRRRRAP